MNKENAVVGAYVTVPDEAIARSMAHELVSRRLAACANIFPAVHSVYRWEGRIESEAEVVVWLKTTTARRDALTEAVRELHPFEVPCLVFYPASGGLPEYLDWVRKDSS